MSARTVMRRPLDRLVEARLARAWRAGQRHPPPPEPADPALVRLAHRLRARSIDQAADRHARSPHRVLLCTPPSWAARVWFEDLAAGLNHMGVACLRKSPEDGLNEADIAGFRPTVVVALDQPEVLARIDLPALRRHHDQTGCVRLLVPTRTDLFRAGRLDRGEARRLHQARQGATADAYVSLYVPELWAQRWTPWAEAGFGYLSLPQACNPLEDGAIDAPRTQAWGFCSARNPARLRSVRPLRPLLARHAGEWAGQGWSFGGPPVAPAEMPAHYARARVVLAPLVRFLRDHPAEITHRVFEAAACGAFQVTHPTPITRRFFSPDALVTAHPGALAATVERWLPRVCDRQAVAERALLHVYAEHTVFHRVDHLLGWLERWHGG